MTPTFDGILLTIHIVFGFLALFTGPIAMFSAKANKWHRRSGKIFALSMTFVFITAIVLSAMHTIPFLFMLSFLSYYAVFAGVRITRLKQLHRGQRAKWYDWLAGGITFVAGIVFVAWGAYIWISKGFQVIAMLAIIFGLATVYTAYGDMKPFYKSPDHPTYWWFYHMGNMLGGYTAALTAFLVTTAGRVGLDSPMVWLAPLIVLFIATPFLNRHYRRKFGLTKKVTV